MALSGRTAANGTEGSGAPATVGLTVGREALVAFEDRDDARLPLRLLRPGFRHCFCLTGAGRRWTLCDPLKSRLALAAIDGADAIELAAHLRADGRRVLRGIVAADAGAGWPAARPLTCVEIVKRLVGVRAPGIVTPHQLYRHLLRGGPAGGGFVEVGC